MKKINLIIIISSILLLGSCSKSENLSYLSGYWEILSVTKTVIKLKITHLTVQLITLPLIKNLLMVLEKK